MAVVAARGARRMRSGRRNAACRPRRHRRIDPAVPVDAAGADLLGRDRLRRGHQRRRRNVPHLRPRRQRVRRHRRRDREDGRHHGPPRLRRGRARGHLLRAVSRARAQPTATSSPERSRSRTARPSTGGSDGFPVLPFVAGAAVVLAIGGWFSYRRMLVPIDDSVDEPDAAARPEFGRSDRRQRSIRILPTFAFDSM